MSRLLALAFVLLIGLHASEPQESPDELRALAEQGDAAAQYNLGLAYANGEGVPQDDAEAVRWYRLAADQGLATAQFALGVMYENGQSVPQDFEGAARWIGVAADQGFAPAQSRLGGLYEIGHGIPQSFVRAHMWYNLAAAQSSGEDRDMSVKARNDVAGRMTSEQIAEAHRLAREWKPTTER